MGNYDRHWGKRALRMALGLVELINGCDGGHDTVGLYCIHGRTRSKAADAASIVSSSPRLPTIWSPIGNPSDENPAGTVAAGCPTALIGRVKAPFQYCSGYSDWPLMFPGNFSLRNAGKHAVGESSRSYSSNKFVIRAFKMSIRPNVLAYSAAVTCEPSSKKNLAKSVRRSASVSRY